MWEAKKNLLKLISSLIACSNVTKLTKFVTNHWLSSTLVGNLVRNIHKFHNSKITFLLTFLKIAL